MTEHSLAAALALAQITVLQLMLFSNGRHLLLMAEQYSRLYKEGLLKFRQPDKL